MPRLRKKHLPHLVIVAPFEGEGAEGETWGAPIPNVPAYVQQKARLVVDRRAGSPTAGQEIVSPARIHLLPENDVQPRARITVWAGTARERTSEVVASAFRDYPRAPNHVAADVE